MLEMQYIDDSERYAVNFRTVAENIVELAGTFPQKECGFKVFRPGSADVLGDYSAYVTVYRQTGNSTQFSSDGSVFVEPEPIPDYGSYEPTLKEIKTQKIAEMNDKQQKIIQYGIEVTLTDGTTERFTLKDQDQMSLMGLQTLAQQGVDRIPWHEANNEEHCKYYGAEDMNRITGSALSFVSYQVTYFRDLRIYINSMLDKESVQSVEYGMHIPSEYQSEVLSDFYSAGNA